AIRHCCARDVQNYLTPSAHSDRRGYVKLKVSSRIAFRGENVTRPSVMAAPEIFIPHRSGVFTTDKNTRLHIRHNTTICQCPTLAGPTNEQPYQAGLCAIAPPWHTTT